MTKPKILFICDVKGWAWWLKSKYLTRYLEDSFSIDTISVTDNPSAKINQSYYDLYVTYGHKFIEYIPNVPKARKVTGVTAHRDFMAHRSGFGKCVAIHANSLLLYNEIKGMHDNIYYLPNGVDTEEFSVLSPIPPQRKNIVAGHVGKLSPKKCQREIIEPAIKLSKAEYIYHYNNYKTRMSHEAMVSIYQKMDVFIVASIEDGTPNTALEAMACGRPVISNAIGNMPEIISNGSNGFIIPRKVNHYVERLNWSRNNRDKLILMGANARKIIEEGWTWKVQAGNYRKMFNDLLGIK